ncbi:MAG TPA: ABC transporter ATP-binding protein [Polyangiaceae bacterium]|nr:ABC transporter ATP-binding protein [Polyangiaceae bacterium]
MTAALRVQGVGVKLAGRLVLDAVSLELDPGRLLALVGPNGAGKTTLLRAALGGLPWCQGEVLLGGRSLRSYTPRERAAWLGFLPQQLASPEPLPVLEVVQTGRFRFDESESASRRAALLALERAGISALRDARLTELSGGERQRVAMATLLAQEARLALLDEPASHLDPAQQIDSYGLISELLERGLGVLLVTHDINLLSHIAIPDRVRVLGLARGRSMFELAFQDPALPGALTRLFGVRFHEFDGQGKRLLLALERVEGESEPLK